MASLCNVHLRIISGHDLPKTDLFSHIDPYIVVSFRGEVVGRTVTRDNNPNPVWQEDFFFEAEEDEEGLHGVVTIDLYDEEVTRDEHVGSIVLDFETLGPDTLLEPVELPVSFKSDKRGQKFARTARKARVALQVVGLGKGFSAYASELGESEEALLDEASSTFLIPVPETDGCVWTGMRFGPRSTQLLLLSCQDPKTAPNPAMCYDFACSSGASLRVERVQYRRPVKLMGLKVWSELRAVNLPVGTNLGKVRIQERPHRLVDTLDPAEVLVAHNYMIGMPFLAAVKELSKRSAHIDTNAQSIWIKMDTNQPQPAQLLQLDYSPAAAAENAAAAVAAAAAHANGASSPSGGGGSSHSNKKDAGKFPALRICSTTSELNKGYELAFFGGGGGGSRGGGGAMVSVSETFRRPVPVLGGQYDIVHTLELRDAFVGDTLEEVGLGCYELVKPTRTWRFGKLLDAAIAGAGGEEYGDDGGGGGRGANGAYVEDGEGGAMSAMRSIFGCLPLACLSRPRADVYRQEDRGGGGSGRRKEASRAGGRSGGGDGYDRKASGRVRAAAAAAAEDDGIEDGEDHSGEVAAGRGRTRRAGSGGGAGPGPPDAAGRTMAGRSFKGSDRPRSKGVDLVPERNPSNTSAAPGNGRMNSRRLGSTGSVGQGAGGGRGPTSGAGGRGRAPSVGSSSDRSTGLVSYNSKTQGPPVANSRSRLGGSSRKQIPQRPRRSSDVEEDEDDY